MFITTAKEGAEAEMKQDKHQHQQTPDNDIRLATVDELLATARDVLDQAVAESALLSTASQLQVPEFSQRELSLGPIIGRGGFSVVQDIERIKLQVGNDAAATDEIVAPAKGMGGIFGLCFGRSTAERPIFSAKTVDMHNVSVDGCDDKYGRVTGYEVSKYAAKRRRTGCRYVMKTLRKDIDKISYMKGNVDIALEANFLGALDHPNIIDLVGVSTSKPCTPDYFLVIEKMSETLGARIKRWMDSERLYKGMFGAFCDGKRKVIELYHERIAAAYDIASGLLYLHSKNIIFRDLKPANIGFDGQGQLKIFDLGLCKELQDKDLQDDGTYRNMTALTGAIRFMAPEVGLGMDYNLSADVYSWAMVMWFILALEPPFGFYTENMIVNRVHKEGARPTIFKRWNEMIRELLLCAWDADFKQRPNFLEITLVLKQELIQSDHQTGKIESMSGGSLTSSDLDVTQTNKTLRADQDPLENFRASFRSNENGH